MSIHYRPITADDAYLLSHIYANATAMRWLSADGLPLPPSAIDDIVARNVARWQVLGYGTWLFFQQDTFIGYCGLKPTDVGGAGSTEVLYAVVPDYWQHGYGTQMLATTLAYAHDVLALSRVVGYTLTTNIASQRLMIRHGFVYRGTLTHVGLAHVWYDRHWD